MIGTLFTVCSIITVISLIVTILITYRIYSIVKGEHIALLMWGFIVMAVASLGFVATSLIGSSSDIIFIEDMTTSRFIGQLSVAIRVIPMLLIMGGMWFLYKAVNTLINGGKK